MDVELEEARQTFETNFFSVIHMCQTFIPLLIKAKGTIVQIGSIAGVSFAGFASSLLRLTVKFSDNALGIWLRLQRLQSSTSFIHGFHAS
jgi:NAD(P)-dependent dehydrogenase (short-subunit alcohol dehydrogenase family)